MDIIIIDDLEDYDSTREEGQRIYSRNKLAEIGTRKVEETAEIAIGSRQHPDDIPSHLLALQGSILQWEVIVDSAHDKTAGKTLTTSMPTTTACCSQRCVHTDT